MKGAVLMSAAILLSSILIGAPTAWPAPPVKPVLKVELWPPEQSFGASYEPRDVKFGGRVTLDNAVYAKYEVFLESNDNPTWATSPTPDYVVFWGTGSADFNITVRIPAAAARQTAKIWVESRVTYEDVDVAGNISAPVYLSVGALPPNTNNTTTGGSSAGPAAGDIPAGPVLFLVVVICVPAICIWLLVRRLRKRGSRPA